MKKFSETREFGAYLQTKKVLKRSEGRVAVHHQKHAYFSRDDSFSVWYINLVVKEIQIVKPHSFVFFCKPATNYYSSKS